MNAASATELCETWARGRGSVGLAVAVGGSEPLAVHVSQDAADEPAFLAYSITKTLLATLLLRLQEAGRLDLDDALDRWLPAVPHAGRISLRQLLHHSAGIPDYGGLRAYHEAVRATPTRPWSFARFAAETWEKGASRPIRAAASSTRTPATCCSATSPSRSAGTASRPCFD
ncbi:MAG: serine hydrolase, partial [Myxococcota bacterium]